MLSDFDSVDLANALAVQRFIDLYLLPPSTTFSHGGVTVIGRKSHNRSGVPQSADTWSYEFIGPDWGIQVRAVIKDGELFWPRATHCRILHYKADDPEVGRRLANEWLRSLEIL